MLGKKENNYFNMLAELVDYSCEAANLLQNTLVNFNINEIEERIHEMHNIEHEADVKKHDMMNKLAKEFITPIERGDIIDIAHYIDNVTDDIEEVLTRIYMYNIREIKKEAIDFSNIIINNCNGLKKIMREFYNYKKSVEIQKLIININDLEEEGDRLYFSTLRNLYTTSKDPIELMTWTDTLKYFEKCCDACESVANLVESVIMKNS
ncbi:MAG: DUF47 family protein [Clostridium sp.]|uniref:DUF47 domain-containing protein n=1 Tax=Clostridium sp. TaxID=1506 RepID=UPI0025FB330E|nr:DUF47 family protein [Clostridium sp.]MCI6691219.1 DUF47 family protein [Clostridium sp.]MDY2629837.1 DUF47 family protein [Clostridium sp.]MDY6227730.1 DUF47 family protein [Clostridium sp.]